MTQMTNCWCLACQPRSGEIGLECRLAMKTNTTNHLDGITYVETRQHPNEFVTIVERWEPAQDGEYAPLIVRDNETGEYINMKLVKREVRDEGN